MPTRNFRELLEAMPVDRQRRIEKRFQKNLASLAGRRTFEWSDSWSDKDLADATAASVRHFEEQEREER